MKDLTSDLDDKVLKGLHNKIELANAAVSELKEKLTKKDEGLEALRKERDEINLKYVEIITQLRNKADELEKVKSEVEELKKSISSKDEEIKTMNFVVDEVNKRIGESDKTLREKEELIDNLSNKLEKMESELRGLKPPEPGEFTSEDRLICSNCGAVGKDLSQIEDKSKVLGYVGHLPMYAKVNVCKKCGTKFE